MNVHIGNVSEFNEQFEQDLTRAEREDIREACDIYSGITPFLTDAPSHVVLPLGVDDERWWDLLTARLGWEGLAVHVVDVPDDGDLCAVVAGSPTLRTVVDAAGPTGAVVPWGETEPYRKLVAELAPEGASRSDRPSALTRAESKTGGLDILAAAAEASAAVTVPRSRLCTSPEELIHAVRALAGGGRRLIAKSNFGVSGYGTCSIDPVWARDDLVDRFLDHLTASNHRFGHWPILVQEEVVRVRASPADLTGDGEVLPDGSVVLQGNATMLVDANHYGGAVTACSSMVPDDVWATISAYTYDVGVLLAADGYRGWYDVDLLQSVDGRLYALEINARRTGPVAAFTIASRAKARGLGRAVACRDAVSLPGRFSPAEVFDALWALEPLHGGTIVPTSFLGLDGSSPAIGLGAIAAGGLEAVAMLDHVIDRLGASLLANDRFLRTAARGARG